MSVHPIVLTVTIIVQLQDGKTIGSASGFFYESKKKLFLVTNKHVFHDKKKGIRPDEFKLILHKDSNDVRVNGEFKIKLYEKDNHLWKQHPKYGEADIALIGIDKNEIQRTYEIKAFSSESFLPEKYPLFPGEDIFIMGYPLSFHDTLNNLPLFRNAMVASIFGVYFQGMPLFLTDANLHPGTSGSPIITKPKNTWVDNKGNVDFKTGTIYYLIGIHSGTVDPGITSNQDIGLGAGWYAKLIEDIAEEF